MNTLNVATVAFEPDWKDLRSNIEKTEIHIKNIKNKFPKVHVILFPEVSLTGYVLDESNKEVAQNIDGDAVENIKRIARENNVAIISSFIEKNNLDKPFNTQFVIDGSGEIISKYQKNHLFTESVEPEIYSGGESLSIFDIHGWKCGISTCFDIRFPRLFESYKKEGVECIFSGFNWVKGRNKINIMESLVKARAHENQFFMVAVDRSGSDINTSYHGVSFIVNPYSEEISTQDGVYAYAELSKSEITSLSQSIPLEDSFKESYNF